MTKRVIRVERNSEKSDYQTNYREKQKLTSFNCVIESLAAWFPELTEYLKGDVMKFYFLALSTLLIICVGCALDSPDITKSNFASDIVNHGVFDKGEFHAPPAAMMRRPGPMVDGPGPGVMNVVASRTIPSFSAKTSQVRFLGPAGMSIGWMIDTGYAENQLVAPGRYNFNQGATYRLKLANIPGEGREGVNLYPTLQVYPTHPRTDAYLSHNSIPVELTHEDLDQVENSNFVTKVIYLPDAKHQELAIADVETLVSTRLDPGVDAVAEADRRGTIMCVLRIGNMDLEMPGAPGNLQAGNGSGNIQTVSYDGDQGQYAPPKPISRIASGPSGVPFPTIVGNGGIPGQPAYNPISGVNMQSWGMPTTGTPIGLPGPPHLPLGGPAGLKSHTIRNQTRVDIGKPVDHFLLDVKHEPGYRLPHPVKHMEYKESHPVHSPGEVSQPAWNLP